MIVSAYLSGRPLAGVFDGPVRGALSRLGELWQHDERGILVEHRGSAIVIEALHQLRALLPPPPVQAAVAVGAAPGGDHYVIPSLMAAIVLREAGYRDINYGPNTPLALLASAAREHHARLAWVSFSTQRPTRSSKEELAALAEALRKNRSKLIVGGRFAPSAVDLRDVPDVRVIASMTELAAFAEGMRG
jgi:methanogenic corrinoid protein MtbC1